MSFTAQIEALYVAYFNRPADSAGLDYWNSVLAPYDTVQAGNSGNLGVVSSAFAASSEYTAKYAGMSSAQVVNQVYLNLFGHAADAGGLLYWSTLLTNGSLHMSDIVTDIAGAAQGTDLTAYQNQVTAATAFTAADQAMNLVVTYIVPVGGHQPAYDNAAASQYLSSVAANPGGASGAALQTVLATNLANALNPTTLQAAVTAYEGSYIIPGHTTLTVDPSMAGNYDMSVLSQFNAIDLAGATTTSVGFVKVAPGTPLSIDTTMQATSVLYQTADTNGSSDAVNLTLGTSAAALGGYIQHPPSDAIVVIYGINTLALEDANQNGIGTVNINSAAPTLNLISTLTDNNLSVLNITGTAGLHIQALTDNSASFTLNDAASGPTLPPSMSTYTGADIYNFDAPNLGTLNLQGASYSTLWLEQSQPSLALANTDSGGAEIYWFAGVAGQPVKLSVSGSGATTIYGIFDQGATGLAVTDTASANLTLGTISAVIQPSNLAFTSETYSNSSSGTLTVQGDLSPHLATLTLTGNVVYDDFVIPVLPAGTPAQSAAIAFSPSNLVTTGVTVSGASDNLGVGLMLTGAAAGNTDSITLGNGANIVIDQSTAGTVDITAGTGTNIIEAGVGYRNTTGTYNIALGAPAASPDQIIVGAAGSHYATTTAGTIVTGASKGDLIEFSDSASSSATLAAANLANYANSAAAVTALITQAASAGAHGVAYGVYGGNTYVVETLTGTPGAADTTIVELIGSHGLTASSGYVTIAT